MSDTHYEIGGVPLEYCSWQWPLFRGAAPRLVELPQRAERFELLKALPYRTEITVGSSYGDGVNPPEALSTIKGVRVVEVRRLGELGCTLVLSDCRFDLKNRVCPSDYMLRFRDGWLDGTYAPLLTDALKLLAEAIPELGANLAPDAYDALLAASLDLPESGVVLSGAVMPMALDKLLGLLGVDLTVGLDGLIRFVLRDDLSTSSLPPLGAYLWLQGGEPTWLSSKRTIKGLPKTIIARYPERHALRLQNQSESDRQTSSGAGVLTASLKQVYLYQDKYLRLSQLLNALGLPDNAITDELIARLIFTQNFEGSDLARLGGGTANQTSTAIHIIKQCWRRLFRIEFENPLGRMGGWTDLEPGKLKTDPDKDLNSEPSGAVDGKPIESRWIELFGGAIASFSGPQGTLDGAVVAITHTETPAGNSQPSAPFTAIIEHAGEGIIRLMPSADLPDGNEAHLGEFTEGDIISVAPSNSMTDEFGRTVPADFDLRWPSPERLRLDKDLLAYMFLVATRRLPNDATKWTTIELPGFADGDVDVVELEVGDELYALRDYVGPNRFAQGDGFGRLLNKNTLEKDAARRVARYMAEASSQLEGKGVSLGTPLAHDLYPSGAVREIRVEVDGLSVRTIIEAGNLGDAEARERIAAARESRRVITSGGRAAQ